MRRSAIGPVVHVTLEFHSLDDARGFIGALKAIVGGKVIKRLETTPLNETISLYNAHDDLWIDTKLLNDPMSVFCSRNQETAEAIRMEAALDRSIKSYANTRPEQIDDVPVTSNDCVVHNGYAFYISCRACVINCSCGDQHHLFCWYDRKGNWIGEDGRLYNQCKTTFDDGYIKQG